MSSIPDTEGINKRETLKGYKALLVLLAIVFFAGAGCATNKKTPCKPFRKKINCLEFGDWQCKEELQKFGNDFVERFNTTRKEFDHLTVNTLEEGTYNLKYRLDFDVPTIYVDITHCVNGEVVEKKRIYLGGEYR